MADGAICIECSDTGYFIDEADHLCKMCSERFTNCMWCNPTSCYRCQPGFYLYTDSEDRVSTDLLVLKYSCIEGCTANSGNYIQTVPVIDGGFGKYN